MRLSDTTIGMNDKGNGNNVFAPMNSDTTEGNNRSN